MNISKPIFFKRIYAGALTLVVTVTLLNGFTTAASDGKFEFAGKGLSQNLEKSNIKPTPKAKIDALTDQIASGCLSGSLLYIGASLLYMGEKYLIRACKREREGRSAADILISGASVLVLCYGVHYCSVVIRRKSYLDHLYEKDRREKQAADYLASPSPREFSSPDGRRDLM